jgi:2-polyprenyl-6-methoxyphenol hydroxylase-like FAD-dependent oxidoreductase
MGATPDPRATAVAEHPTRSQPNNSILPPPHTSIIEVLRRPLESAHRALVDMVPWITDRVDALTSFDGVKLLDVQLNRLRRWYDDGVLLIGDAAHAMSPVGGIGINLAVADAVATARILAGPLRAGPVSTRELARVQAPRWTPTAILQAAQRIIHTNVIAKAVSGNEPGAPRGLRLVSRSSALQRVAGYLIAIGPLPEHAPKFAGRRG